MNFYIFVVKNSYLIYVLQYFFLNNSKWDYINKTVAVPSTRYA